MANVAEILKNAGFPEEKTYAALHVGKAHSGYGGPDQQTIEQKVAQDAYTIEYFGAIEITRAVVR